MTEVNGSTINYWPALFEGAYAGFASGIASASYVQGTNLLSDKYAKLVRTGVATIGYINTVIDSDQPGLGRLIEHSLGGLFFDVPGLFWGWVNTPFLHDFGSILLLDDLAQTDPTKILGRGRRSGYGSPVNNWHRNYLCKRLPFLPGCGGGNGSGNKKRR